MATEELRYFVFSFTLMVFLSVVLVIYANVTKPKTDFMKSACDGDAVLKVVNASVYDAAAPEQRFFKDNVFYVCPCAVTPCLSKCCPWGESPYSLRNTTCSPRASRETQKQLFSQLRYYTSSRDRQPYPINTKEFEVVVDFLPKVPKDSKKVYYKPNEILLFKNGTIEGVDGCGLTFLNNSNYCFDTVKLKNGRFILIAWIGAPIEDQDCTRSYNKTPEATDIVDQLNTYAMIVSGFFFMLTFIVYAALPALQSLSGKCLMCCFLSMFVANCWNASRWLKPNDITQTSCAVIVFSSIFSNLCSYFWMNTVNFDIWLRLSGKFGQSLPRRGSSTRFYMYSAYSWGCPLLIVSGALLVEYYPYVLNDKDWFIDVNTEYCWFTKVPPFILFLSMPLGVLVFLNTVLFVLTLNIVKSSMNIELRQARRHSTKPNEIEKERMYVCLKLMPVMGVYWILEILGFFLRGSEWMIVQILISFLINCQGILVFKIFVCKRNVLRDLSAAYCPIIYDKFFASNDDSQKSTTNTEMSVFKRASINMSENDTALEESVLMSPS